MELTHSKWVNDAYKKCLKQYGYVPRFLDVYNATPCNEFAPTVSTRSNGAMGSGTVLVIVEIENGD